jgi:hypothetical protein
MSGKSLLFKILFFILFLPIFSEGFEVKVGDLIFRRGIDKDSDIISFLSNFEYSHIGVIISISPEIFIIHATTSDIGEESKNAVIKSSFNNFIKNAKFYAIKRFNNLSNENINLVVKRLKNELGKPFILADKDEKNLYCTTLIQRAFDGVLLLNLPYEKVNVPFFSGKYLFPKAFWNLPNLQTIFISKF